MPHSACIRRPEVILLHEASDLLIALSYFLIPLALIYFVRKRRDLVYPWLLWLFGLFIVSCGCTHLLAVYVLWHPVYRFDGLVKAFTAVVSFPTAVLLIRLVPRAAQLPSSEQLRKQNETLLREIAERQRAEAEVRQLNQELEGRVQERTTELQRSNLRLEAVLDALPISLVITDKNGKFLRSNPALHRLWGADMPNCQSSVEFEVWEGYWPETGRRVEVEEWPLSRALRTGEVISAEQFEIQPFAGGERRILEVSAAPVRGEDGAVIGGVVSNMDITERVLAERKVHASEATLSAVIDALPVGIVIADANGRIVRDNAANRALWGVPPETTSWEQYSEWVGYWPETGKPIQAGEWAMSRALLKGEVTQGELVQCEQFDTKQRRWFLNNAAPVRNREGQIIAGVVAEMDVTEQRRTEQALQDSEARFRTLVEQASDAFFVHDFDGHIVDANRQACLSLGYSRAELLQMTVLDLETDFDLARAQESWAQIRPGEAQTLYGHQRRKDGTLFPVEVRLSTCEIAGRLLFLGLVRDITERQCAESALRESEARFRQLADSMPQMVWSCRPDGLPDYYNQRWHAYTGTLECTIHGEPWRGLVHSEDEQRILEEWTSSLRTGEPYQGENRLRRYDGTYRWNLVRAVPVRDEAGQIERWYGTCTDIDQQKRVENELRRANHDLEQFAYSASHDLQEPLRNIAVFSQLVQKQYGSQLEGRAQHYLKFVSQGARRMSQLITDLLVYTKTSNLDDEAIEPSSAERALEDILRDLQEAIAQNEAVVTHDALPTVAVNRVHLYQVLQNLIGNALKYRKESEPPRIHISAQPADNFWRFSVQDNGLGIKADYHQRIFGLFKRLHGNDGQYSGTGIGLSLCQKIVERYGGRIWLQSELECGSTFYFLLPQVMEQMGPTSTPEVPSSKAGALA